MIIPELGLFCLVMAFGLACFAMSLPFFRYRQKPLLFMGQPLLMGQAVFISISFFTLMLCFLQNNFSVDYVAHNSNTKLPLVYKITALWGAHEGSFLLWAFILGLWILSLSMCKGYLPRKQREWTFAALGLISAGFLFLILHTSNPFIRLLPSYPLEGADLNPLLQDPGFVLHPPFLYLGYVGFAVPFALSVGALIQGDRQQRWIRLARPFALLAWSFLTVGITLGSWWAYYELGWGGWWFWDPVENASLMPWLLGGALCHALFISAKRGCFVGASHALALATFLFSLMGTFLVRSGVLSSVHAFAADPARGSYILAFMGIMVSIAIGAYVYWRAKTKPLAAREILSRESFMLLGILLLVTMTLTIMLGTLYPLMMEVIANKRLSVGPPYFNTVMIPLCIPALLLMTFVPYLHWNRDTLSAWRQRIKQHLFNPSQNSAMKWAHRGVWIAIIGMLLVSTFETESDRKMNVGDSITLKGTTITFESLHSVQGPNYEAVKADFQIVQNHKKIATLHPEKRYFTARETVMTETAIKPGFWKDIYIALGEPFEDGSWSVRLYLKPFIRWIWLGGLMIAIAALFSSYRAFKALRS